MVNTGQINLVLNAINVPALNPQQQIQELFNCLSQTLAMQGPYKGQCESALKHRVYALTRANPDAAQAVIQNANYQFDPQLVDVIRKVDYMSKRRLGCNCCARFTHHLGKNLAKLNAGVTFFTVGIGTIILGLTNLFQTNANPQTTTGVAVPAIVLGGSLAAAPILGAAVAATGEDP